MWKRNPVFLPRSVEARSRVEGVDRSGPRAVGEPVRHPFAVGKQKRTSRVSLSVPIAFLLLLLPLPGRGGEIRGRVFVDGHLTSQALVSVEGLREPPATEPEPHYLDHAKGIFVPHVLPILRGSRVVFRANPKMACRLYSTSKAGLFNLSRQEEKIKSLRFDRAGVIDVRCEDHPAAHGYIVVKDNPYYAVTDPAGEYSIRGIPPGKRTIHVFFDGRVLLQKTVKVGKGLRVLDLRVRRPREDFPSGPSSGEGQGQGSKR